MEFRSQPLSRSSSFGARVGATVLAFGLLSSVLLGRVAWLSIAKGEEHSQRAAANLQALQRIEAPRGNILDRAGVPVALNRRAYAFHYARRGRSDAEVHETLRRVGEIVGEDMLSLKQTIMETKPSWTRHTLARRVEQSRAVGVLERLSEFPGLTVTEDFRREYPFGESMASVVGYLGRIAPEDKERFAPPLYLGDSWVGRAGVERQFEDDLVGKRGLRRHVRDARGNAIDEPTIQERAAPGDDLVLTLDATLQQSAYLLLGERSGSVVLMDVRDGDLLALASTPAFDPSAPWKTEIEGQPASFINRCWQGAYPPGSTFKIVTAMAAFDQGWTSTTPVACDGNWHWPGWLKPYHCDNRWGHGSMRIEEAMKRSCNVYFYEAGYQMGGDKLASKAREFGFGKPSGINLPNERAGKLPTPTGGEIVNAAIGQGVMLATPLQVARAFAAIATDGRMAVPRIVREIRPGDGSMPREAEVAQPDRIVLDPEARQAVVAGLWEAVNEQGGTAYKAQFPREWDLCGKTGTAENGRGGVDAWFAGFLPRNAPTHVVVVHIEEADGHGGDVAAPVARELLRTFLSPPSTIDPLDLGQVAQAE